jgi:hypothetical protein
LIITNIKLCDDSTHRTNCVMTVHNAQFVWWQYTSHKTLTFWHRSFTFNSNKSPIWCKNFSVYYPDVFLVFKLSRVVVMINCLLGISPASEY